MAKKFKIANNPTFKKTVKIPRVGGDSIDVEFEYKYLPRRELAKVYQKWRESGSELSSKVQESVEDMSLEDMTDLEIEWMVSRLQDIVIGWNFDDEFNDENLYALVETVGATANIVISTYQESYNEARVGN